MPRYEQDQDDEVRTLLEQATSELRGGNATASVHASADAFIRLIALKPELLASNLPDPDAIHRQQSPHLGAAIPARPQRHVPLPARDTRPRGAASCYPPVVPRAHRSTCATDPVIT